MAQSEQFDSLYQQADFFMLRLPSLPVRFFRSISEVEGEQLHQVLRSLFQDQIVQESVYIASPSLYEAVQKWINEPGVHKNQQIVLKLLRYLIRMSSRCTPFGAFAGVALGHLGNRTEILWPNGVHLRRVSLRPDMEWILSLVRQLEKDDLIFRQLHLRKNSLVTIRGERAFVPGTRKDVLADGHNGNAETHIEVVSLRLTPPLVSILRVTEQQVPCSRLLETLSEEFSLVQEETLLNFVRQLWEQGVLLSTLQPPMGVTDPLQYLIDQLRIIDGCDHLVSELINIQRYISQYEAMEFGCGLPLLQTLRSKMAAIQETSLSSTYLQVDMSWRMDRCQLQKEVTKEIAKAAACLLRLAPTHQRQHFVQFRNEFIERYGLVREVPLLELLDEDVGIGFPLSYMNPPQKFVRKHMFSSPHEFGRRDKILLNLALDAARKGQLEITLTEDVCQALEEAPLEHDKIPDSMEIYATIASPSTDALDQGVFDIVIGSSQGSSGLGKTFGRFAHILQGSIQKIRSFYEHLQSVHPNRIYAELTYLGRNLRSANVSLRPLFTKFEIPVGVPPTLDPEHVISLADLVVGAEEDHLYLRHRPSGKQVVIVEGHMLNPMAAPNVARFLSELSQDGQRTLGGFNWGAAERLKFLPRVRYGKSILSLARWLLSPEECGISMDFSNLTVGMRQKLWETFFEEWRQKWNVPRFCFLTVGDNRLLLDLDNPEHQKELQREFFQLRDDQSLVLEEMFPDFDQLWISHNQDFFVMEVVFPLVKTHLLNTSEERPKPPVNVSRPDVTVRFPSSDWLYLCLYGVTSREQEFISGPMYEWCTKMVESGVIEKWFYIRYNDGEPHIRLRLKGNPRDLNCKVFPGIAPWAEELQKRGFLRTLSIHTYEREVERYGGETCIDGAESVFFADSQVAAKLLALLESRRCELDLITLCVLGVVDMFDSLEVSREEQIQLLSSIVESQRFNEEYRSRQRQLVNLVDRSNGWASLAGTRGGEAARQALASRHHSLQEYVRFIRRAGSSGRLTNSVVSVYSSLVHMFCNRLLGPDRQQEQRVLSLTHRALKSLHFKTKEAARIHADNKPALHT